MVVTEKIDGTNAGIRITPEGAIYAQYRNRLITPDDDNMGFARWVAENAGALTDVLGPGLHFGEWWGRGIQRGYGLDEKRFSLFNVNRWEPETDELAMVPGLGIVPVLLRYTFDTQHIDACLNDLAVNGSKAAPGFPRPEGLIVYQKAAGQVFKVLIENDQFPKGEAA
jgi:hypothetical protein